jgi:hypothetical protein
MRSGSSLCKVLSRGARIFFYITIHTWANNIGESRYERMVKLNQDQDCVVCVETLKRRDFPKSRITGICNHEPTACKPCIAQHISVQLETRTWDRLSCPECPALMAYADVRKFATAETFQRYDTLATRDGLAVDSNFRWCPAPGCGSGQIHNEGANAPIITCISCHERSCFTHQRLWHEGLTCEEVETGAQRQLSPQERADQEIAARIQRQEDAGGRAKAVRIQRERKAVAERALQEERERREREARAALMRRRAEEKAGESAVRQLTRGCPGCHWRIEKITGCDHMTCKYPSYTYYPDP